MPLRGCFLLLLVARLSVAQSPSTTASSSSTVPTGWTIPLVGLEDDTNKSWGLNVSFRTGDGDVRREVFPFTIGTNMTIDTSKGSSDASFPYAVDSFGDGGRVSMSSPAENHVLPLGSGNSLLFSRRSGGANEVIPTVPFFFNLGSKGRWNGSLTLGKGVYDYNRIATYTNRLGSVRAANLEHNGTFLATGKQKIRDVSITRRKAAPTSSTGGYFDRPAAEVEAVVMLDFNSEFITLPLADWCGSNITMGIGGVTIIMPDYLTKSPNRCKASPHTENLDLPDSDRLTPKPKHLEETQVMVFGKPFFQTAAIRIDENGDMYITASNTYDLPPSPRAIPSDGEQSGGPKDPNPPPSSTPSLLNPPDSSGEKPSKKNVGAIVGGTIGGLAGLALIGAVIFFLLRRRARKPPAYSAKDSNSIPMH